MQRLADVGNLNQPISEERPLRTAARLPIGSVGSPSIYLDENFLRVAAAAGEVTVGAAPPQLFETSVEHVAPAVSRSQWRARRRSLLDTYVIPDAFAGSDAYITRSYSAVTRVVRKALDFDIVTTLGAVNALGQTARLVFPVTTETITARPLSIIYSGISGALHDEWCESLVPFLALVRSVLDRDDFDAARKVLDAVPPDATDEPEVRRLKNLLAPPRITVSRTRDADRTREYAWLRNHWQEHRGQWLALDGDNVLATAGSLRELRETLKALNLPRPPLVHRVD